MADRIRTTISLDPEVHEIFRRLSDATGVSVSRCMGDWLAETAEGAQFVAHKVIEARRSPMVVMREFQQMTNGLSAEVQKTIDELRDRTRQVAPSAAGEAGAEAAPEDAPSSNTGLKSPSRAQTRGVKVSSKGKK